VLDAVDLGQMFIRDLLEMPGGDGVSNAIGRRRALARATAYDPTD